MTDAACGLPKHLAELVDCLRFFDVDSEGRIRDNGKFEGEMLYVPLFWGYVLDGLQDSTRNGVEYVKVEQDDLRVLNGLCNLPLDAMSDYEKSQRILAGRQRALQVLTKKRVVRLLERNDGFVCEA